jgi:general secretion pathway protein G
MILLSLVPILYPFVLIYSVFDVIRLKRKGYIPKYTGEQATKGVLIIFGIFILAGFILAFGSIRLLAWYSEDYIKPQLTKDEGIKIIKSIKSYHNGYKQYPDSIDLLIGDNPIRKDWRSDAWGEPYIYELAEDNQSFKLVSKGKDRKLDTQDDIIFE